MATADVKWIDRFDALAALSAADRDWLAVRAQHVRVPAGQTVFAPGRPAEGFLLLLDGSVRVQQASASGREIVLYRVGAGETCIMTTACLLADDDYTAEGITETEVEAIAIPRAVFDEAIARSPAFRHAVFSTYSRRLSDVMHVIETVAFERLDKRLAGRLLELAGTSDVLAVTHQDLAVELGSAREVVSRQLKAFARRGMVSLTRGRIAILDRKTLDTLAEGEPRHRNGPPVT